MINYKDAFALLTPEEFKDSSEKAAAFILIEKYRLSVFSRPIGDYQVSRPDLGIQVTRSNLVDAVCLASLQVKDKL